MRRLGGLVLAAVAVAAVLASSAGAALFFLFQPTAAKPGDRITVRLGGTPASFAPADRVKPLQRPIRIYLVPDADAATVRSRFDPRLYFVGPIVPDRDGHGALTFSAPPLDSGTYVVAAWCPGCAKHSTGRTFFVLSLPEASRYRGQMRLRLRMPAATQACPVTKGRYGNGILSTSVPGPDGVIVGRRDPDGTLFAKPLWLARPGFAGQLTVRGERLDAPGEMTVLRVSWAAGGGSWASAVTFPSEGCWRIAGRVRDISLSYVVKVVAGS